MNNINQNLKTIDDFNASQIEHALNKSISLTEETKGQIAGRVCIHGDKLIGGSAETCNKVKDVVAVPFEKISSRINELRQKNEIDDAKASQLLMNVQLLKSQHVLLTKSQKTRSIFKNVTSDKNKLSQSFKAFNKNEAEVKGKYQEHTQKARDLAFLCDCKNLTKVYSEKQNNYSEIVGILNQKENTIYQMLGIKNEDRDKVNDRMSELQEIKANKENTNKLKESKLNELNKMDPKSSKYKAKKKEVDDLQKKATLLTHQYLNLIDTDNESSKEDVKIAQACNLFTLINEIKQFSSDMGNKISDLGNIPVTTDNIKNLQSAQSKIGTDFANHLQFKTLLKDMIELYESENKHPPNEEASASIKQNLSNLEKLKNKLLDQADPANKNPDGMDLKNDIDQFLGIIVNGLNSSKTQDNPIPKKSA